MQVVVCIKQVPDTTEIKINPATNTLMREGVPSIINPFDVSAIEEAVRIKEKYGAKVTVISMGPPQAKEALRRAVSFGVDRAILLSDRAFAGADTLATSYTLSQAIKKLSQIDPVALVLCGKQAIDGDTAQVGPGIAGRLNFNQLTYIIKIKAIDFKSGEIEVERKIEEGAEIIKSNLPALITVLKEMNEPRFATLPNWIKSQKAEVEVWDKNKIEADDAKIGLKGSPTVVNKTFPPPPRGGKIEMVDVKGAVAKIFELKIIKT